MYDTKKQSGFTLIEIAIVLVIIGLLLGGILKGQELINSARVRNMADQSSGLQAAYYGFIDRYRHVPGDWGAKLATQGIGLTVNLPADTTATTNNNRIDNLLEEAAATWEQLAKSGFIIAGGFTPATAAPTAATYSLAAPANAFSGALVLSRNKGYTGAAGNRLNLHMGQNVPVNIARELDVKVDDGLPNTGVLRIAKADGTAQEFDGTIFANVFATCTTVSATLLPGGTAGNGILVTDIYDIFDDDGDCGQVFLY